MKVRTATPEDLEAVSQLNQELFEHDSTFDKHLVLDWPNSQEGQSYFSSHIIDSNKVCFVVESATVIGYIAGSISPDSTRDGLVASLDNMCVQAQYRGQGFGTALLKLFKEWSISKGAKRVSVSAYTKNEEALSFYKARGFQSLAVELEVDLYI